MNKKIITITGPTASGKSEVALKLAIKTNGEIISADSMQIYKYMNIGTAKPIKEANIIKHHMIDEIDPTSNYSVANFSKEARNSIDDILKRNKTPIICGGTGFYIESILYDISYKSDEKDETFKARMQKLLKKRGKDFLYSLLKKIDPESCEKIHVNNVRRVIRALEIHKTTKNKISLRNVNRKNLLYNAKIFYLRFERETLYDRINRRVDFMVKNGLLDEVKYLIEIGVKKDNTSMQSIGYREIFEYLAYETENYQNVECIPDSVIDKIKQHTRNYAKRQITWFKRDSCIKFLDIKPEDDADSIADKILEIAQI